MRFPLRQPTPLQRALIQFWRQQRRTPQRQWRPIPIPRRRRARRFALITVVQVVHNENASASGTIAVTITGVTLNNGLIALVTCADNTTVSQVSDGTTNFNIDKARDATNEGQQMVIASLANSPAGSRTITATCTGSTSNEGIQVFEVSGVAAALSGTGLRLSGTPSGNDSGAGTATSFDASGTSTVTTVDNGALVVAYGEGNSHQPVVAGAYSLGANDTVNLFTSEYQVQGTAGAINPSFTMSVADKWAVVTAAYKPAAAGGIAVGDDRPPRAPLAPRLPSRPSGIDSPPAGFAPRGILQEPLPPRPLPRGPIPRPIGIDAPAPGFAPHGMLEEPRVVPKRPQLPNVPRIPSVSDLPAFPGPAPVVLGDDLAPRRLAPAERIPAPIGIDAPPPGFTPRAMLEDVRPRGPIIDPVLPRQIVSDSPSPLPTVTTLPLDDPQAPGRPRAELPIPRAPALETPPALPLAPALDDGPAPRLGREGTLPRSVPADVWAPVPLEFLDSPMPAPALRVPAPVRSAPRSSDTVPAPPILTALVDGSPPVFAGRLVRRVAQAFGPDSWFTRLIAILTREPTRVVVAPFATTIVVAAQSAADVTTVVVQPASPTTVLVDT